MSSFKIDHHKEITEKNDFRKFTFIAHWVEPWNWLFWWVDSLNENPNKSRFWIWLAPIYWSMSIGYLFGKKSHDIIDQFLFNENIEGQTVLLRNFGWHFFVKSYREKIRQRILEAILNAQANNTNVVDLGALTKAEWLTKGGQ
jgi:hypothetical protein